MNENDVEINETEVVREIETKNIKIKLNQDATYTHELSLAIDYTDVSREELIKRALKTDVIRLQAGYRKQTEKELDELEAMEWVAINATEIGNKRPRTVNISKALEKLGFNQDAIDMITKNPDMVKQLMGEKGGE